jgi:hypothetical protein
VAPNALVCLLGSRLGSTPVGSWEMNDRLYYDLCWSIIVASVTVILWDALLATIGQ